MDILILIVVRWIILNQNHVLSSLDHIILPVTTMVCIKKVPTHYKHIRSHNSEKINFIESFLKQYSTGNVLKQHFYFVT